MSKSNFTKNLLIPDFIFIFLFSLLIIFVYDNFGKFFDRNINDGFLKATAISNKKNCRIKDKEFNCLKETLKDIGKNRSVLFFSYKSPYIRSRSRRSERPSFLAENRNYYRDDPKNSC